MPRYLPFLVACALVVSVSAQQPAGREAADVPLARLVADAARPLLQHADPTVRGEAALVVAAQRQPGDLQPLQRLARDRHAEARRRGIVALGLHGTAAAAASLAEPLATVPARSSPEGAAAAFAVSLLPSEHGGTLLTELLQRFERGSMRRQQNALAATLLGLGLAPHRTAAAPLQRLWDERHQQLDALAAPTLGLLLRLQPDTDDHTLLAALDHDDAALQLAALQFGVETLANRPAHANALVRDRLLWLARRGSSGPVRAMALRTLIALRHGSALEVAIAALAAADAAELAAGVEGVLTLGGARMAATLEAHLCAAQPTTRKLALLRAYHGPASPTLLDHCAALAADRQQDFEVRGAAALLLAGAAPLRAAPLLRDLYGEATTTRQRISFASALVRSPNPAAPLTRLLPEGTAAHRLGNDWLPLLAAGHPEAEMSLLALLDEEQAPVLELQLALRAWRLARVLGVAAERTTGLEASLATLLGY